MRDGERGMGGPQVPTCQQHRGMARVPMWVHQRVAHRELVSGAPRKPHRRGEILPRQPHESRHIGTPVADPLLLSPRRPHISWRDNKLIIMGKLKLSEK